MLKMPTGLDKLTEGWLELESDPGLFTLLLEDFGVEGVEVVDIYDTECIPTGTVFGFIFLFPWIEERGSARRRKLVEDTTPEVRDENVVNNIFFAEQKVHNSCATHALVSILLNCPNLKIGSTLNRLKQHTFGMNPENKGWAIGNTPELARAHNAHATPNASKPKVENKAPLVGVPTRVTGEAFHFISFVPINGRLFELDGLKGFPIDHGPWDAFKSWTDKFKFVIKERMGSANANSKEADHNIHANLMAVVPDKRKAILSRLQMHQTQSKIVLDELKKQIERRKQNVASCSTGFSSFLSLRCSDVSNMSKGDIERLVSDTTNSENMDEDSESFPETDLDLYDEDNDELEQWLQTYPQIFENRKYAPRQSLLLLKEVDSQITTCKSMLVEEFEKRKKYEVDDRRKTHDYTEFINTFLTMMAEHLDFADIAGPYLANSIGKVSSQRQYSSSEVVNQRKRHGNLGKCRKKK